MTKLIYKVILCAVLLAAIGVGFLLLRNNQMDKGVYALKHQEGPAALEYLKPLAQLGDKTAQMLVASIYAYGWGGIPKSDANAIYWFRCLGSWGPLVAQNGVDPAAPYLLVVAKAYASGSDGVKADPVESLKWLNLAAAGGSKEAAAMLAQLQH